MSVRRCGWAVRRGRMGDADGNASDDEGVMAAVTSFGGGDAGTMKGVEAFMA